MNDDKNTPTDHLFEYTPVAKNRLLISLCITTVVLLLELIGGLIINSIALISDAGHMFTHAFAIGIGLLAIYIAKKPPCHHKTFGLYRAEVLGAFINGLFLLPIAGVMIYEAILRIFNPEPLNGYSMLVLAIIGLATNLTSILLLLKGHKTNLNVKGVFYHMFGDAASSIGIVVVSIIIVYTNWTVLDPIVSIGISLVILYWAASILRESARVLLEIAPEGINSQMIRDEVKVQFPEILQIYHMHLWTITPQILVFSASVKIIDNITQTSDYFNIISRLNCFLTEKFNIIESTIQIATKDEDESCKIDNASCSL